MPSHPDREISSEPRLMPDPFYVGSALATTVGHILPSETYERPIRNGERRLGKFILPPWQRPPVWTREQQIKLIESVWLELPIGVYVYNEAPYGHPTDGWLIDGQQRVTALLAYIADEFPVFGYRWSEIPKREKSAFTYAKAFPCIKLNMEDEAKLADIYNRLAYGGTPHEPKAA